MAASRAAQEVKAGNMANAATPGYKRDTLTFESFRNVLLSAQKHGGTKSLGNGVPMAAVAEVTINTEQGALDGTGNPWDLALVGDGFFALQNPNGEIYYTRNGRFSVDTDGYLVNEKGWYVLGREGTLDVRGRQVDARGNITNNLGDISDALMLVSFPNSEGLVRQSADHFSALLPGQEAAPEVKSGYLEASNTDLVTGLTDMMMLTRTFEMGQSLIKAQDKLLDLAVNQVGSLRG